MEAVKSSIWGNIVREAAKSSIWGNIVMPAVNRSIWGNIGMEQWRVLFKVTLLWRQLKVLWGNIVIEH